MSGSLTPPLTLAQVRTRLGIGESLVRALVRRGDLRAFKVGAEWRVDRDDLEQFVESRKNRASRAGGRSERAPLQPSPRLTSVDADAALGLDGNRFA